MKFKFLLIAISISSVSLSAADFTNDPDEGAPLIKLIKEYPNSYNSDVKALVQDYLRGEKPIEELNNVVKSLQAEIYDLVDAGQVEEAQARRESLAIILDPLYDRMDDDEEGWRVGEETLGLIARYIDDHDLLVQEYRTVMNTTSVEQ